MLIKFIIVSFIPFLMLFSIACEIYFRSRKSILHQLTALLIFLVSLLFLSEFCVIFLPLDDAVIFTLIFKYCNAFLIMSLGIYYFRRIFNLSINGWWLFISTIPLSGILLIIYWLSTSSNNLIELGPNRIENLVAPLVITLLVGTIYTFIMFAASFIKGYKIAHKDTSSIMYKKRVNFLVKSNMITLVAIIVVHSTILIGVKYDINLSFLSPYGNAFFAFSIRYAMVSFDFLQTAYQKFKLIFNVSSNGIVLVNNKYEIVEANPAFCMMIDTCKEDVLQRNIFSLLCTLGGKEYVTHLKCALFSSIPIREELYLERRDGHTIILELKTEYFEVEDKKHSYLLTTNITKQKQSEEKLSYLAFHDPLTGIGNRRLFYDRFHEMKKNVNDINSILIVVLVDLDKFKSINDTFGHATGDGVIQHVANQLVKSTSEQAHVSRMGGDEFTMLIPSNNEREIDSIIKKISDSINDSKIISGKNVNISGSIGISLYPKDGKEINELLKFADKNMYEKKEI